MLKTLQIKNYVLIDSLEIQFPAGLIIITGQTGAGKSILLGALSLALGGKSDVGMIGAKGETCVVEAVFEVPDDIAAKKIIEENDLEWEEGRLTLRRVLNRSGRARAFINDAPVSVNVLHLLSQRLLDIHSQNQTMLLSDRRFQLSVLDHYAGNTDLLGKYTQLWLQVNEARHQLEEIDARLSRLALEKDFNESLLGKLEDARLRDGEMEELDQEQKQLANAEEIKSSLCAVESLLASEEDDRPSLDSMLREASRQLEKISRYVPQTKDLASRMESSRLELEDVLSEVSDLEMGTEVSQDRLETVEDRMSLLYDLMKKHGCSTIAELISVREQLAQTVVDSSRLEEERQEIGKKLSEDEASLVALAGQLSASRKKAAGPFAANILSSLKSLELEYAVFDVQLEKADLSSTGQDAILFRFSSTGQNPVDVAKCASGGEKSRIMLCLKSMMARYTSMPSMVFDEIDTGVSGSVADKMGSMICRMGQDMQVFAITHLPQVAAKGNVHFKVSKIVEGAGSAVTRIDKISGDSRISEIARLLSGSSITPEAIANAESLLNQN